MPHVPASNTFIWIVEKRPGCWNVCNEVLSTNSLRRFFHRSFLLIFSSWFVGAHRRPIWKNKPWKNISPITNYGQSKWLCRQRIPTISTTHVFLGTEFRRCGHLTKNVNVSDSGIFRAIHIVTKTPSGSNWYFIRASLSCPSSIQITCVEQAQIHPLTIGDFVAAKKYIQFISWHVAVDGWASVDICTMHQLLFECKSALRDENRTCTDWPTIFSPLIASIIYVSVAQRNSEWFFLSSLPLALAGHWSEKNFY